MPSGEIEDSVFITPYRAPLFAGLWAWVGLNTFLILWLAGVLEAPFAAVCAFGGFGALMSGVYVLRETLLEMHSALTMREKFYLFVIGSAFPLTPFLFTTTPGALVCAATWNIPLIALACEHKHFQRVYCLNLLLAVCIARSEPGLPPLWLLAQGFLVCFCFAADYLAFKAEGKPSAAVLGAWMPVRAAGVYFLAALGAAAAGWLVVPSMRPRWGSIFPPHAGDAFAAAPPPSPRTEINIEGLLIRSAIAIVLTIVLFLLMRWWHKRLARRKSVTDLPLELADTMERKTRAAPRKAKARFDMESGAGRIVHSYNALLDRLAKAGLAKATHQTPAEYAKDLPERSTAPEADLARVTATFERAYYAGESFSQQDAEQFRARVERIQEATQRVDENAL